MITPSDLTDATSIVRRCQTCDFFSTKTVEAAGGFETGKCFRDSGFHDNGRTGPTYYVAGDMVCPAWRIETLTGEAD